MKQNVKLSTFCVILTTIWVVAIVAIILLCVKNLSAQYALGIAFLISLNFAMFYMPLSLVADEENLYINRPYSVKIIPLSEIEMVQLCPPTMSERRICGSGGIFGYWGWFREPSIGKYFAYYGKASDCFLVVLKDGTKYLLGCQNVPSMVDYLRLHLK